MGDNTASKDRGLYSEEFDFRRGWGSRPEAHVRGARELVLTSWAGGTDGQ